MALSAKQRGTIEDNIVFAIQNNLQMRIYYRGDANVKAGYRVIEPYLLGYGNTGEIYLRAYAVDGVSLSGEMPGWKLFFLYRIRKANVRFTKFSKRGEYKINDSFIQARIAAVLSKGKNFVNKVVMNDNSPVYKCIINPEDLETGVNLVSIVDEPAIERYFVAMSKQNHVERIAVHLSDDEKRIVTGPVMIPDKLIFRKDESGNPFYIYFDRETILECSKKYFRLNAQNQSNVNHENKLSTNGVTAFESWIIKDSEKDKANALGMELPEGTWMLSYHIQDNEVWSKIKSGELKGFSLEGFFDYVGTKAPKEVNNKKQIDMNKIVLQANEVLEKIKSLFSEEEAPENTQLTEEWVLQDETVLMYDEETGAVTMQDGTPAPDGEYILADGRTVVVQAGMLAEIKDAAPAPSEQQTEEPVEQNMETENVAQGNVEAMVVKTVEGVPMYIDKTNGKVLVIDESGNATDMPVEDGQYELEDGTVIEVKDGVMVIMTAAQLKKMFEEKLSETIAQLETAKSKYEKMKSKLKETEENLSKVTKDFETFKTEFSGEKPNFIKPDNFSWAGHRADKYEAAQNAIAKALQKK